MWACWLSMKTPPCGHGIKLLCHLSLWVVLHLQIYIFFPLCDVFLTEAYRRPFSFMAKYLPENRPLMATTPTSTAVISNIPGKNKRNMCLHTMTIKSGQKCVLPNSIGRVQLVTAFAIYCQAIVLKNDWNMIRGFFMLVTLERKVQTCLSLPPSLSLSVLILQMTRYIMSTSNDLLIMSLKMAQCINKNRKQNVILIYVSYSPQAMRTFPHTI